MGRCPTAYLFSEILKQGTIIGFDIDFSYFRCVFNYHRAYLDSDEFVDKPETTGDLLKSLSLKSLDDYNHANETEYEFVKVVKANFHVSAGIMFLITFEVKDAYDKLIKLFQARVRHVQINFTEYVFCRPKPDQRVECVGTVKEDVEKDVKKQRLEY
ncbi:hypothetical protein AALP_AA8G233100 [Arabis alpina]|uniref:Cystatin domain-containing protein n=1 Tax=Arabis alpina TaxID=50452 RepID=A0A087G8X4_ARAAL|nr:hypothetical protein AALP_AA8G233100 [Arabis alpina]